MNKAVFFDRDGVINKEIGDYVYSIDKFEINKGVIPAMSRLKELGYLLIIISNQGGIAKSRFAKHDVEMVHTYLNSELSKQNIQLTEIYYCPHHSEIENCICRKPDSTMIEKAIARYDIDPSLSFMIGDKKRDVDAAKKAGILGFLIEANRDIRFVLKENIKNF